MINRLTIVHPSKREGGLIKCLLDNNDKLIVDDKEI